MLDQREQYQLELLNRARLDPLGEVARNDEVTSLNAGLPGAPLTARPKQPLAPNALLTEAAEGHSAWMLAANIFSHTGAGGSSIAQRAADAGYTLVYPGFIGENISWTGVDGARIVLEEAIVEQNDGLFASPGHRTNILRDLFREVGISQLEGSFTDDGTDWSASMLTNKFGLTGTDIFLTGVVYDDLDGDGMFSIGEGRAGAGFTVGGSSTQSMTAGGYALRLPEAESISVTVTFDGRSLDATLFTQEVTVPYGDAGTVDMVENVKLDLVDGTRLMASADMTLGAGATEAGLLGVAGLSLQGNDAGNLLIGNPGDNRLTGGAGDDTLQGGAGNDTLDGGGGQNVALFSGQRSLYDIVENGDHVLVTDSRNGPEGDGANTLHNIQVLRFADGDHVLGPQTPPPPDVADITAEAVEGGPEATGNLLDGASGTDLRVVAVNDDPDALGEGVAGTFGRLTVQPDGGFGYVPDAGGPLPEGVTDTDRFLFTIADAAGQTATAAVTFTVTGVNDPAAITGPDAGTVVEDDPDRQSAEGVLTVTDLDSGEAGLRDPDPAALAGSYGSFLLIEEGQPDPFTATYRWRYELDNDAPAVQSLPEGAEVSDSLTLTSLDGTATETLTVTVIGVNDPASIAGDITGAVVEDDPDRLLAEGMLTVTDPDAGEDRFAAPDPAALTGSYGSFTFDPDSGAWAYSLANDSNAVRSLAPGEEVVDNLTVTSLDGTASETISIRVTGTAERDLRPMVELSGSVTDREGAGLADTRVVFTVDSANGESTTSGADGSFVLPVEAGGAGRLDAVRAHMAGDPTISTAHALETLRIAVGLDPSWGPAAGADFIAADFDGDGAVTTSDALGVLRTAVGLTDAHAPRWVFLDPETDLSGLRPGQTTVESGRALISDQDHHGLDLMGILIGQVEAFT